MSGPDGDPVKKGSEQWGPDGDPHQNARLTDWLEQQAADPGMRHIALRTLSFLALRPGMHVLEVGCGPGVFLPVLAQTVAPTGRVVGIDHSASFLHEARRRVVNTESGSLVSLQLADAYHLPFADASFDAAHAEHVLEHLEDPDAVLREMRRVVRPGGWVAVGEPYLPGYDLDHPDTEGVHLVLAHGFKRFRNPRIGLELNRRMAQSGMENRKIELFTRLVTNFDPHHATVFAEITDEAVAEGLLTRDRADSLLQRLREADQGGYFVSYYLFFLVAGQVCSRP